MTTPTQKYSEKLDAIFDAAINNWQIRNLATIDTAFAAGIIDGLRDQVKELLNDATLTENGAELD